MERHFLLPATIAAALHAGLLFGFRTHSVALPAAITKITRWQFDDPLLVEISPPVEHEEEAAAAPKGVASDPPPSLPEHPEPPRPNDFPIELPSHPPVTKVEVASLPNGPIGVPTGTDISGLVGPRITSSIDLDNAPRARLQTAPVYPPEARHGGLSGEVLVEFSVDESGTVFEPRVVRSSDRLFEDAALRAVARWRFEPGRRSGRVVRFKMSVPIVFSLGDS